jgi:hypothetical protein
MDEMGIGTPDEKKSSAGDGRISSKEELLWKEVQSLRELMLRLAQWGITVMAALHTAIYYVRRDIVERMVDAEQLKPGANLPLDRYVIGFLALVVVAFIFSSMSIAVSRQWRHMRQQLIDVAAAGSGIDVYTHPRVPMRWGLVIIYFIFPLMDLLVRIYVSFEVKFV